MSGICKSEGVVYVAVDPVESTEQYKIAKEAFFRYLGDPEINGCIEKAEAAFDAASCFMDVARERNKERRDAAVWIAQKVADTSQE